MRAIESRRRLALAVSLVFLAAPLPSSAFYLPGVAPTSYQMEDLVPLHVNHLTPSNSKNTPRVRSVYAYDYYTEAFHHCEPEGGAKDIQESLGSILFGDRIRSSPFELYMRKNETCKTLCREQTFTIQDAAFVKQRIWQDYNMNWIIDGLPAALEFVDAETNESFYSPGFPLGSIDDTGEDVYLNNHFDIYIDYHEASNGNYRVVGVLVDPISMRDTIYGDDNMAQCKAPVPALLSDKDPTKIAYTYSVYWRESPTQFATRWDKYLHVYNPRIHWFWLITFASIVFSLVSTVSTILVRTLRKDIARYNRLDEVTLEDLGGTSVAEDGVQEDSGWKLVHGDVFRPPKNPLLLSVLVGNGAQLFMMTGITIAFALLGFLSPSSRGSLGTAMVLLYAFLGFIGGYISSRVYKFFHGESWKLCFTYTPLALPALVFVTFFLLNLFVWARKASGAVPFTTMLVIVLLWFLITVPLSLAGSWVGFRQPAVEPPVRTNQIPRQIPPMAGFLRPLPSMLVCGMLPFGAIYLELFFIMNSIWFSKVYYMFGFLFLCYGLMVMTAASVTVLLVYYLLCAESYHWQWRAFAVSAASGGYVFLSALVYWVRVLSFTSWTSGVLYLGYSALISVLFAVLTGTVGFVSAWLFTLRIYRSIKVD